MKSFVQYGAGNIGRGFIGQLFSQAGYEIKFVDVNMEVINALNSAHRYPISVLSNELTEEIWVENASGIDGTNSTSVSEAIANADMMATAVGVNILTKIVPNLVAGIRLRISGNNRRPLNIIICENLIDADKLLHKLISEQLTVEENSFFDRYVGLVEASIGRMVPIMTEEMKAGNLLRVCVERYCELPVDRAAFKGEIPDVPHLFPYSPFEFYIKRKLFLHNMGHCLTAFLGELNGDTFIWESMRNPYIKLFVLRAMTDSAVALSKKFQIPIEDIIDHVADLMLRFSNVALGDTNERVGKDIQRKLSKEDRFVGTLRMLEEVGGSTINVCLGIALGLSLETNIEEEAILFLKDTSGITKMDSVYLQILTFYKAIQNRFDLQSLLQLSEELKTEQLSKKNMV